MTFNLFNNMTYTHYNHPLVCRTCISIMGASVYNLFFIRSDGILRKNGVPVMR
jgi:hypothetical protein